MLVIFEGIDGSGKSTQIKQIQTYYESKGFSVCSIRQPGQTKLGELLRPIVLEEELSSEADLFLFLASHIQGFHEYYPNFKKYDLILFDRSILSTAAYQGASLKKSLSSTEIIAFYQKLTNNFKVDLLIYFDLNPTESLARVKDINKFELKGVDYLNIVYQEYQNLIQANILEELAKQVSFISVNQSIEEIFQLIRQQIDGILKYEESHKTAS